MTHSKFRSVDFIKYVTLLIGVFVVLFPPYVVIINAFKSTDEFNSSSSMALPKSFLNFDNFIAVFQRGVCSAASAMYW